MIALVPFLEFILSVKNMWILLAVLLVLCIADLFKRHLLSNTAVYSVTMLLVPLSLAAAVAAFFASLGGTSIGKIIFSIIGCLALLAVAATVYVRGNIFPVDKNKIERSPILTRLLCTPQESLLLWDLRKCYLRHTPADKRGGDTYACRSGGLLGSNIVLPVMLLLLLVPFVNIIVICFFLVIGAEFVILGVTAFMTLLPVIMIANGCIRYILTTDKTKGKKVLWILLSLIPAFNFVYGIWCIVKINKKLERKLLII